VDPDATLQWLRGLAEEVSSGRCAGDGGATATELAWLFMDLDTHLCKGGALPAEWRPTADLIFRPKPKK
jgi:hypothetical protein